MKTPAPEDVQRLPIHEKEGWGVVPPPLAKPARLPVCTPPNAGGLRIHWRPAFSGMQRATVTGREAYMLDRPLSGWVEGQWRIVSVSRLLECPTG